MRQVITIAKYTFVEAIRDKFIYIIVALMLSGLLLGQFIKTITLFGSESSFPAVSLSIFSIAISCVSVLYVNIATRRELDGKLVLVILTRPVSNLAYLMGRLIGFWLVSMIFVVLATILVVAFNFCGILTALKYTYGLALLQFIVIMWSLFFSLLLSSLAASVIMSVVSWLLFNSSQVLWMMSERADNHITYYLGKIFYYILPNYQRFDLKHAVLYYGTVDVTSLLSMFGYAVISLVIVTCLAWLDFSKKEY